MKHGRVGSILSDQQVISTNHVEQVGEEYDGMPYETDAESVELDAISIGNRGSNRH